MHVMAVPQIWTFANTHHFAQQKLNRSGLLHQNVLPWHVPI
jgi:hypothetical protein